MPGADQVQLRLGAASGNHSPRGQPRRIRLELVAGSKVGERNDWMRIVTLLLMEASRNSMRERYNHPAGGGAG
jgi:hypothetical protein